MIAIDKSPKAQEIRDWVYDIYNRLGLIDFDHKRSMSEALLGAAALLTGDELEARAPAEFRKLVDAWARGGDVLHFALYGEAGYARQGDQTFFMERPGPLRAEDSGNTSTTRIFNHYMDKNFHAARGESAILTRYMGDHLVPTSESHIMLTRSFGRYPDRHEVTDVIGEAFPSQCPQFTTTPAETILI